MLSYWSFLVVASQKLTEPCLDIDRLIGKFIAPKTRIDNIRSGCRHKRAIFAPKHRVETHVSLGPEASAMTHVGPKQEVVTERNKNKLWGSNL